MVALRTRLGARTDCREYLLRKDHIIKKALCSYGGTRRQAGGWSYIREIKEGEIGFVVIIPYIVK